MNEGDFMKILQKFLSIFLIGSLLCFSMYLSDVFVTASDIQVGYVKGTNVRIRSEASTETSDNILGKVSNVYVTVHGTKQGTDGKTWYYITYQNIKGYIHGDYIEIVQPVNDQTFEQQLAKFPESYKPALRLLHAQYPNWRFQADAIGLTLDEAVALEITRKVVPNSTKNSWLSMGLGAYDWNTQKYIAHDTNWYVASRELIRYYMDPRNFLNATDIYTYMQLGYDPATQTKAGLDKIIAGTFLAENYPDPNDTAYGGSYSKVLMAAAQQSGVSPYVLASTVIQEQGTNGTSSLISGTYPEYEGYYNFFNVQTYGDTTAEKVTRGLTHAKNQGWSSRSASIIGGAKFIGEKYIAAGQSTYFDMNFNIKHPDRIWHEYAGAPHYALACGQKIAKNYKDSQDAALDFKIPVYRDMPSAISAKPAENTLHNNYYFNSITAEGLTPSFERFTYSYDLRTAGDKVVKVTLPSGASYASADTFALKKGQNKVVLKVKAESGYTTDYVLNVQADTAGTLIVDHGQGNIPTPQVPPTPVVTTVPGDTNGDSIVNGRDLANIQMQELTVEEIIKMGLKNLSR